MVLPGLVGLWIDQKLGTVMVFLVLGVILGMTSGLIHLIRMTSPDRREAESREAESKTVKQDDDPKRRARGHDPHDEAP